MAGDPAGSLNPVIASPPGGDHTAQGAQNRPPLDQSPARNTGVGLPKAASATLQRVIRGVLLALAAINNAGPRSEAAKMGSVTLQLVRDWVARFGIL
jgi:hypothetical protein